MKLTQGIEPVTIQAHNTMGHFVLEILQIIRIVMFHNAQVSLMLVLIAFQVILNKWFFQLDTSMYAIWPF
jgi:hypothetical protein